MIIKNFAKLFFRKKERAMQERAERSRKVTELEEQFNKTQHNLETVISEITNTKKQK